MDSLKNSWAPEKILGLAIFIVSVLFIWEGSKGFNLWDEGFLWYGAQRVILGEVPIRDFVAYDPARYYWSASLMSLFGDNGIMELRVSVAIFQALGLFVGLLLISQSIIKKNYFYLLLCAVTLTAWMFPRHKLFDISLSIFLLGVLAYLVSNPTRRRYFIAGLCVGLVATFGRNHGVYTAASSLGVMLWLSINRTEGPELAKAIVLWVSGIVAGFSPIFFMSALVPGFGVAFLNDVLFLFEIKTTNLPLPIPWPWLISFDAVPIGQAIRELLVGFFFIATVIFGLSSIAWVVWSRIHNKPVSPAFVAAAFLALPYAHFAFSRADVGHLAQGIFPLLIGCFVLLATQPAKVKWTAAIALCTASLWVMHVFHPGWQCHIDKQCVSIEISGSNLQIDPATARDVELLRKLADQYAPDGQGFIVMPFWPGAYALLERKSPVWEIYALFPSSPAFEQAEIERIKAANPRFALVYDLALDGRDELRFRNTHPEIYQFILDTFQPLPGSPNPAYQIYLEKEQLL